VFLKISANFKEICDSGKIILSSRILNKTQTCGGGETFEYFYKWYLKSDTMKTSLDTNEYIRIVKKGDYCVQVKVITKLGTLKKSCYFDFCETIDENIQQSFFLDGKNISYRDSIAFFMDTVKQNNTSKVYHWIITGGTIITTNSKDSSSIRVQWDSTSIMGKVCLTLDGTCDSIATQCIDVLINPTNTKQVHSKESIRIIPNPNNGIFYIDGLIPRIKTSIEIISYDGKSIYKKNWTPSSSQLNLDLRKEHLAVGAYHIMIKQKGNKQTQKLIINRMD
jgi:Secretion system C-terminal sorting domain